MRKRAAARGMNFWSGQPTRSAPRASQRRTTRATRRRRCCCTCCAGPGRAACAGSRPCADALSAPCSRRPRAEIEAYLEKNHLGHVEDETNADTTLRRNFLRLELMPQIERFQPGAAANFCRAAELLRAEDDYLDGARALAPAR